MRCRRRRILLDVGCERRSEPHIQQLDRWGRRHRQGLEAEPASDGEVGDVREHEVPRVHGRRRNGALLQQGRERVQGRGRTRTPAKRERNKLQHERRRRVQHMDVHKRSAQRHLRQQRQQPDDRVRQCRTCSSGVRKAGRRHAGEGRRAELQRTGLPCERDGLPQSGDELRLRRCGAAHGDHAPGRNEGKLRLRRKGIPEQTLRRRKRQRSCGHIC